MDKTWVIDYDKPINPWLPAAEFIIKDLSQSISFSHDSLLSIEEGFEYEDDDSDTQDVGAMYPIEQEDDSETQDVGALQQLSSEAKKRGPNQKNWAIEGKERLLWNQFGLSMGPRLKVARFSRYLGILAKDFTLFPINVTDFRHFKDTGNFEMTWNRVKETIDWSDPWVVSLERKIKKKVRCKLNERWKHWKSQLRKKWYKPFRNTPQRFQKPNDDHVHEHQWQLFVTYMDKQKHQKIVRVNKINRSQRKMNQITGTRTYANVAYEFEIAHGKEPDRWELFKLTHQRKGTQEPIDAATAKAIADFEEAKQRRLSMNIDITALEIREELYAEVLGKEKGNRVRSLGAGVTWDEVPGIHVEERGISSEVKQLREQLAEQERKAQDREARMMEEVQTKMAEERKRMEEMFEFRCVDMALQKMGQVFKQCGIPVDTQEDVMETLSQLGHQMSQRQAAVAFSQVEDVYRPTLPPIDCQNMQMDD